MRHESTCLAPDDSSLQVQTIETDASDAQRVVRVQDGYLVVGSALTSVGTDGATRVVLDQAGAVDQPVKVNESTSASNAGA